MEGDLGGILIADFDSVSDYATGTRETVAATDAFAKYEKMQTLYLIGSGTPGQLNRLNSSSSNIGLIALVVGLLGLTSIAGFYFLKLRNNNHETPNKRPTHDELVFSIDILIHR